MRAGTLTERLVIRRITDTTNAIGGKTEAESTVATVWAEPVPLHADERFQAQAIGAQTDYRFRVRVRADVTPKQRIQWKPRWPNGQATLTLEIHGVLVEPSRESMLLDCGVFA